jgi:hypothetical protein
MKSSTLLGTLAALLLIAGCSSEEPAAPDLPLPQEEASTPAPPAADEPMADESTAEEPTVEEPTVDEPTVDEPTADEPTADEPTAEVAPEDGAPGLAVGEQAPAFELPDQQGKPQSLAGILESGPAALVFYRSADW